MGARRGEWDLGGRRGEWDLEGRGGAGRVSSLPPPSPPPSHAHSLQKHRPCSPMASSSSPTTCRHGDGLLTRSSSTRLWVFANLHCADTENRRTDPVDFSQRLVPSFGFFFGFLSSLFRPGQMFQSCPKWCSEEQIYISHESSFVFSANDLSTYFPLFSRLIFPTFALYYALIFHLNQHLSLSELARTSVVP